MRNAPSSLFLIVRLAGILAILLVFATSLNNLLFHQHETPLSVFTAGNQLSGLDNGTQLNRNKTHAPDAPSKLKFPPSRMKKGSKTIIASTWANDTTSREWLKEYEKDWEVVIYSLDDATAEFTTATREQTAPVRSLAYLKFITDNWMHLPEFMVFLHGDHFDRLNDHPMFEIAPQLDVLKLRYVYTQNYTSLRCRWWPSCPATFKPEVGHQDVGSEFKGLFAEAYRAFFDIQEVPELVGHPANGQFAVHRRGLKNREIKHWVRYIYWLRDQIDADVPSERLDAVMDNMWHIIFDRPADDCSYRAQNCYCEKFGLCALKCPDRTQCGLYWPISWDTEIPKDWPVVGQGENGLPVDGWWKGGPDGVMRPPALPPSTPPPAPIPTSSSAGQTNTNLGTNGTVQDPGNSNTSAPAEDPDALPMQSASESATTTTSIHTDPDALPSFFAAGSDTTAAATSASSEALDSITASSSSTASASTTTYVDRPPYNDTALTAR